MIHKLKVRPGPVFECLDECSRSPGFIAVHRRIKEHRYYSDPQRFWAFLDILMAVRFRAGWVTWRSGRHTDRVWVPRGAMLTSVRKLTRRWHDTLGWSETRVWRFLKDAEKRGELIAPAKPGADCTKHDLQHHPALLIVVNYAIYNPERGSGRNSDWNRSEAAAQHPTYKNKARQGSDKEASCAPARHIAAGRGRGIRRVCDAFRDASGKSDWVPTKGEIAQIAAAIGDNDGEFEPIARTVYLVTKRDVDRGKDIRSVCYGLAVWKREREAAAIPSSFDVSSQSVPRERASNDLHRSRKPEPITDEQAQRGKEAVQRILLSLDASARRQKP